MRRRRNPDRVPVNLCALNPRRWHKKTLQRPWRYRDRFHDAVDDIGMEKLMKRRRRNPMQTRRNCNMTFLSQDQEDRIVSRIAAARNPAGGRRSAKSWWRGLSPQKRMRIARSFLGKMNPGRSRRNPKRRGAKARLFTRFQREATKFRRDEQRRRASAHDDMYRSEGDWHGSGWFDDSFSRDMGDNPSTRRRNPKRDGSPTRGEKRRVKYVDYLKSVIGKSEDARLEYQRLTATVAKAGAEIHKPVGPRAMKHALKEFIDDRNKKHEAELEMTHHTGEFTAPSVAAVVEEHPELKFITSRLSDIDSTIAHFQKEIRELPQDDLSEDEEARLQEEIVKLARQKKLLREKLAGIQPAMSNPRRRGARRRISSGALRSMKRCADRCARALKSLRTALRRH